MTGRLRPVAWAASAALLVALLGGAMTDTGPWYQALAKPSWQPPDWLFGPAWTLIYACTVAAAVMAWPRLAPGPARQRFILLFALNALINVGWSFLFFRLQRPDLALIDAGLLWLSVLSLVVITARPSPRSALLLAPYLAWVSFAFVLNLAVVRLNP